MKTRTITARRVHALLEFMDGGLEPILSQTLGYRLQGDLPGRRFGIDDHCG